MQTKQILLSIILAVWVANTPAIAADIDELTADGQTLMQEFSSQLESELFAAMGSGGPVNALIVYSDRIHAIEAGLQQKSGWTITRTSHLLRNPENAPDEFAAAALAEFLVRQENDEPIGNFVKSGILEENGQQVFRMVQAIATDEICLTCHGAENVRPPTARKLVQLYPQDMARGFSRGNMLGVYVLTKVLE